MLALNLLSTLFVMNTVSNHRTWTVPHNDEGPVVSRWVVSDSLWPLDCSLPGFSVHEILQARILDWVTISSSRGSSRPQRSNLPLLCLQPGSLPLAPWNFELGFYNMLVLFKKKKKNCWDFLVIQWWRIHLQLQGWQVGSLVRVDPIWLGAMDPMHHDYWSCGLNPGRWEYWAPNPQILKPTTPRAHGPQQEKPLQWEACALQLESSPCSLLVEKAHTTTKAQDHQK